MNAIFTECLIEFLCEKMPIAKMSALETNIEAIVQGWLANYVNIESCRIRILLSPYRLCICISKIPVTFVKQVQTVKGPKENISEDIKLKFAQKFAQSAKDLFLKDGFWCLHYSEKPEEPVVALHTLINIILSKAELPEKMFWSEKVGWIRPIRRIVCIFDGSPMIFNCSNIGIKTSVESLLFLNEADTFAFDSYASYISLLKSNNILIDAYERSNYVLQQINGVLKEKESIKSAQKDIILKDICSSSECPTVYRCSYNDVFNLPESLRNHIMQKEGYILIMEEGKITNKFLTYSDCRFHDNGKNFIKWAERVVYNFLQEANYYWNKTMQIGPKEYLSLVKENPLIAQQTDRILMWLERFYSDRVHLLTAAEFINIDLFMPICIENPDLTGIVTAEYIKHIDVYDPQVGEILANSIYPKNDDEVPNGLNQDAAILSFIKNLDSIVQLVNIHGLPKGSSDPLGIRRRVFAALRLGFHINNLPKMSTLLERIISFHRAQNTSIQNETYSNLMHFFREKMIVLLAKNNPQYAECFVFNDIAWTEKNRLLDFLANSPAALSKLIVSTKRRLVGIINTSFTQGGVAGYSKPIQSIMEFLNKDSCLSAKYIAELCNLIMNVLNHGTSIKDLQEDKIAEVQELFKVANRKIDEYVNI